MFVYVREFGCMSVFRAGVLFARFDVSFGEAGAGSVRYHTPPPPAPALYLV